MSEESVRNSDSDHVLRIGNVVKRYGDVTALDDVSLDIASGEFFTLLGPSGSGKSTLLHIVGGHETPTTGTVTIEGKDVTDLPPQERPVSTVFQEYQLFPHMSAEENIRYGLKAGGVATDRQEELVEEYTELLQIPELLDRAPSQLSGGQRQRVALARALVTEPEILLLDEPLGPLDEKLREQMQVELSRIQSTLETTFIHVTHNQEEALTISDRIGLLDEGKLIEVGTPDDIYNVPKRRFTAEFIGKGNLLPVTISDTSGGTVEVASERGNTFRGKTGREDPSTFADGDAAYVSLRPNTIRIDGDAGENSVTGQLRNEVFKGEKYEYIVDVDGRELVAYRDRKLDVSRGEEVVLSWDVEDCIVVTESERG